MPHRRLRYNGFRVVQNSLGFQQLIRMDMLDINGRPGVVTCDSTNNFFPQIMRNFEKCKRFYYQR